MIFNGFFFFLGTALTLITAYHISVHYYTFGEQRAGKKEREIISLFREGTIVMVIRREVWYFVCEICQNEARLETSEQ